jgi:hypothetical protein
MPKRSITLVGRASQLKCLHDHVSFLLTVKSRTCADLVVECRAFGQHLIEKFESMDEDSFVGVIGSLLPIQEQDAHSIVRLTCLEPLGKSRQQVQP